MSKPMTKEEENEILEDIIKDLESEIRNLNDKVKLYATIIQIASKYARENIPGMMPNDSEYIRAIVGGAEDVDGTRFLQIWISKAKEMIKEKSK